MAETKKNQTTLSLNDLKPGLVLPSPIYDGANSNVLLLGEGTRISSVNLQRLRDRGVTSICIDTSSLNKIHGNSSTASSARTIAPRAKPQPAKNHADVVRDRRAALKKVPYSQETINKSRETLNHQSNQLQQVFDQARVRDRTDCHSVQAITNEAAECLVDDLDIMVRTVLEVDPDVSTHKHCLRVGQLAMTVAAVMRFPKHQYVHLSMGCLMSRLGVSPVVQALLEKPEKLTNVELFELKKVPLKTFEILQHIQEMPTIARQVAYQIFERHDGSGYPRGRSGNQIHPLAKIAGICDTYVALTSDRPHRKGLEPYFAIEMILKETKKGRFCPATVRGLLQTVSLFPIGSFVLLTDDSVAEVMRNTPEQYDAPVVRILAAGNQTEFDAMVDLNETPGLSIQHIIPCAEVKVRVAERNSIHNDFEMLGYDDSDDFPEISHKPEPLPNRKGTQLSLF